MAHFSDEVTVKEFEEVDEDKPEQKPDEHVKFLGQFDSFFKYFILLKLFNYKIFIII